MIDVIGNIIFFLSVVLVVILIGGVIYMIHDMFRQNRRGRM